MALRVLLVEDDHAYARLLEHMLRRQYRVLRAESFEQASAIVAREAPFDIVILDLNLPDSRGLLTLHRLLVLMEQYPQVHFLVLTGMSSAETDVVRSGVSFLSKDYLDRHPTALATLLTDMVGGGGTA